MTLTPITNDQGVQLVPISMSHDDDGKPVSIAYRFNGAGPAISVPIDVWASMTAEHERRAHEEDGA